MSTLSPTQDITQQQVNVLLEQLKMLRLQVAEARAALIPIEENLETASREYQDKVNPLRREISRLQWQIDELRERLEGGDSKRIADEEEQDVTHGDDEKGGDEQIGSVTITAADSEAVEKDKLLEHVFRVLDPMMNPEDAGLIGQLQELCARPVTTLADMLERLDWGPVWEQKDRLETLLEQYRRLTTWEQALSKQLAMLSHGMERLRQDPRYGLWQQRQKGAATWQDYLNQVARQFENQIDDLQATLTGLRQQWERRMREQS